MIGFLALAGFGWQLSRLDAHADAWSDILPALVGNGMFLMLVMATTAIQTFRDVQHDETVLSNAQQLKNMVAQFGMALGVALATVSLQWRTAGHLQVLEGRAGGEVPALEPTLQLADALAGSAGSSPGLSPVAVQLGEDLARQATFLACLDYFSVVALVGVAGALVMAGQRLMK